MSGRRKLYYWPEILHVQNPPCIAHACILFHLFCWVVQAVREQTRVRGYVHVYSQADRA